MSLKAAERKRLYTLLNIGWRELGWAEEQYRCWLHSHGATEKNGKISASTLDARQLIAAVDDLRARGFKPRGSRRPRAADWKERRIAKMNALWCDLADLGEVRNRSEKAMAAWCRNSLGIANPTFADSAQLNQAIEGLKSWRDRVARKQEAVCQ